MWTISLAVGCGLFVMIVIGSQCGKFLRHAVSIAFPERFAALNVVEQRGGGQQLGVLERLLVFSAFWVNEYGLIAGWFVFKVAAKWAVWQHVTKIPEARYETLEDHQKLSSRLLGRFLNGTLYNVFSAGVGVIVGRIVLILVPQFSLPIPLLSVGVNSCVVLILCWQLFFEGNKE